MSSSASGSQKSWSCYGEVPMTRWLDCPRLDLLKRLTCVRSMRGNVGREFVKCESALHRWKDGKDLKECSHFEWMDKYIRDRGFLVEVLPPIQGLPIQAAPISTTVEEEISNGHRVNRPLEDFLVKRELQKLNKQLSQIVELKKRSNMMAEAFYVFFW
ncbi:uncharacterized protein LOC123439200 [Hordeum vulgare subsp. vulgare]|uniref:Uncharacterized protein n=1 Tax=Hordeum vulgare subsp. vulgare TaxID=112509 RepID=A0A8I6WMS4_HORVV|nr:uncharacterized protein LOC123439200 [Hordeum vulgare subsp. vulgare]